MKIQAGKVDAFIASPPADCLGVLIYGPDIGQVSERAKAIISKSIENPDDPFNVTELSVEQLSDGPAALVDALCAMGFGVGKRLVRIRDCGNSHSKIIAEALEQVPDDIHQHVLLVMTAGDLSPGSLRTLCEKSPHIGSLPCYVDEGYSLENVVKESLKNHQLRADSQVIRYICQHVKGDRMTTRQEMNKLALYLGERKDVTLEDVIAVTGDNTESTMDDVIQAIFSGNITGYSNLLRKAFLQGVAPVMLLRAMQRHTSRLHQVSAALHQGDMLENAMKSLRPPVFFKQAPIFKQQVQKLSRSHDRLWKIRTTLYEAEKEQKRNTIEPELACERACLRIANFCR